MQNTLSFAKLVKYIENYSFEEFFNDWNVDDFIDYLYEVSREYQNGIWHCEYGATKMVIIMDDEDIVFKIPFNSVMDHECKNYEFFYGAPATSTWDYCEAEEERYDVAEEYGFANYLAKTEIVYNTKNGIRIYYRGSLPIDDTKWLNTFIDCYGAYKLKQFLQFLENEDWDDDLSHDNIGYTKEGKPVLIDYSSYMEQWIDLSDLDL